MSSTAATKQKPRSAQGTRWVFMKWFGIPDARDPSKTYLMRLRMVQTPMFAVYLHFIFLPDADQDPHDHPWPFGSFIIKGAYHEYVYDPAGYPTGDNRVGPRVRARRHKRFSFHTTPLRVAHQIMWIDTHTVTLVFTGRRTREWHFYTPQGPVAWRTYNMRKYGAEMPETVTRTFWKGLRELRRLRKEQSEWTSAW